MPKNGVYDGVLYISCPAELREQLLTLAYMRGDKDFSPFLRNILARYVEEQLSSMDIGERRMYAQVLKNVQAQTVIRRQKRTLRV